MFENLVETKFRTPIVLAAAMASVGLLMWYAERVAKKMKTSDRLTMRDSIIVGFSQALALVPGTSRSGITISSGLLLGYKREDAARFSFLLSIPIIAGAAVFKLKSLAHGVPQEDIAPLVLGTLSSAVFGFLSIKYFMRFVQRHTLKSFVWYRFLFAAVILIFLFTR